MNEAAKEEGTKTVSDLEEKTKKKGFILSKNKRASFIGYNRLINHFFVFGCYTCIWA